MSAEHICLAMVITRFRAQIQPGYDQIHAETASRTNALCSSGFPSCNTYTLEVRKCILDFQDELQPSASRRPTWQSVSSLLSLLLLAFFFSSSIPPRLVSAGWARARRETAVVSPHFLRRPPAKQHQVAVAPCPHAFGPKAGKEQREGERQKARGKP